MTVSIISGTVFWMIYLYIDALIKRKPLSTLVTPEKDWGPLLMENKRLATHLENLEHIHQSKRVKKNTNVN